MIAALVLALAAAPVPRTVATPDTAAPVEAPPTGGAAGPAEATPPTAVDDPPAAPPTEVPAEAPAPLPTSPPHDAPGAGAIGSDEPPLPPAPPPVARVPKGGPWYGRGWLELGADLIFIGHLPHQLRILSAGLSGAGGWRPHPWFGLGTQLSTFISGQEKGLVSEQGAPPAVVKAAVPITAWDTLVLRLFVPLRSRVEPIFDVSSGFAVERSPVSARRVWGSVRVGAGLDVYVAPTMTLGFGVDYRLLARRDDLRHAVGGRLRLGFHF